MIVAVDGPSGAGKSTVCREVARRTGFLLLDTGALYRAVTWAAIANATPLDDHQALGLLASRLRVHFETGPDTQRVFVDGADVTDAIRLPGISRHVSAVSAVPAVREALLEQQRTIGRAQDSIVEGRDIGTVVFPDAELKVYYTASVDARAGRRHAELLERGQASDLAKVADAIEARDEADRNRAVAPLRQPKDAVVLDTSTLDFEAACQALAKLVFSAQR